MPFTTFTDWIAFSDNWFPNTRLCWSLTGCPSIL